MRHLPLQEARQWAGLSGGLWRGLKQYLTWWANNSHFHHFTKACSHPNSVHWLVVV